MLAPVKETIRSIHAGKLLSTTEIDEARAIFQEHSPIILSEGKEKITILIENGQESIVHILADTEGNVYSKINGVAMPWESRSLAALFLIEEKMGDRTLPEGIKYTREGMRKRVLEER